MLTSFQKDVNNATKYHTYGTKPRLVLLHLNSEAVKQQSPEIEIEDSLFSFIKALGLSGQGHDFRIVKDQLGRLAASHLNYRPHRIGWNRHDQLWPYHK